ncbi:serine/threonine-protein kinase [Gemmatimonas sp.]|uniref:serine/threonine-protein kinase n=1 Tax=Gemmatimonas sp. TaxID=1962908 RepID=UPI003DA63EF2
MNTDALTWPEPAPSLARAVAGEFRLLREIGRGGMGVVFLAEDTQLQRRVAIKTLPPHLAADAAVRERFLREARTAAGLSHPNIVPIYSAAERDTVVYFTMGYVHGESLAERLQRDGVMPVEAALSVTRQLALALEAAHAAGVVHRDIKAENVLLDETGRVLVTDFGIARLSEAQPLTATGTVLGTVQYMSPEQVTGDTLDGRSDLYALGILLYHLLTHRFPFERAMPSAVLVAHVNSAPTPMHTYRPDIPPPVDALVMQLLAKRPDDRMPSARAVLGQLDALGGGTATLSGIPAVVPPARTPSAPSLSSTDAQAVWARAAELQANTGMMVPPANFPAPVEGEPLTRGYNVGLVKDAAAEAGIGPKYVERALAEREAAVLPPMHVQVEKGLQLQKTPNVFLGAHTKLDFEGVVEGELSMEAFEDIGDLARRALGDLITVSAVGRTLTISTNVQRPNQSGMPRLLQLTVAVRNGRTTIRAFEDLSQRAGGLFGGVVGGVGMGMGAMVMGLVTKAGSPQLGLAAWVGTALLAFAVVRFGYGRSVATKQRELRELVEELCRFAQARVAQRQGAPGALPAGPTGRSPSGGR